METVNTQPAQTERPKKPTKKKLRKKVRILTIVVIVQAVLLLVMSGLLLHLLLNRESGTAPTEAVTTPGTQPTGQTEPVTRDTTPSPTETTPTETTPTETSVPETTQATEETEATTQATEPDTQATTAPVSDVQALPPEMARHLEQAGLTRQDLADRDCQQLITVAAAGNTCVLRFFVLENGEWQEVPELYCTGFVGRNGVTHNKREGDGCTPAGLYRVGSGFHIEQAPETGLDLFQVTANTYWVDDPNSKFYNRLVEGTENKDWNSAEHMLSYYRQYLYGFVVDYNTACVPGAGSAIFFHISSSSTSGCIATNQAMVLSYLAKLNKTLNPYILIL